ncbi:hypothetical protein G6F57_021596 [Rhizopus arrhizus]|nr:hypothetical protein G6F57_021596 [Rhizopus arrhizus]
MHVGATKIADRRMAIGEGPRLAKATLFARQLAEQRDVVQHALAIRADAPTHVGFGQHGEQGDVDLPGQFAHDELGRLAAARALQGEERHLMDRDQSAYGFAHGKGHAGIP